MIFFRNTKKTELQKLREEVDALWKLRELDHDNYNRVQKSLSNLRDIIHTIAGKLNAHVS